MSKRDAVFRWLQPFAVTVAGREDMNEKDPRPVLAVEESAEVDPWQVRLVLIVPDDTGRLARVGMENCTLGGVGSWSQLMLLSERSRQIHTPAVQAPPNLRRT